MFIIYLSQYFLFSFLRRLASMVDSLKRIQPHTLQSTLYFSLLLLTCSSEFQHQMSPRGYIAVHTECSNEGSVLG